MAVTHTGRGRRARCVCISYYYHDIDQETEYAIVQVLYQCIVLPWYRPRHGDPHLVSDDVRNGQASFNHRS